MLILARKLGERILVPECNLTITVVSLKGKTVKLGISGPVEVGVYREEVMDRPIRPCRSSLGHHPADFVPTGYLPAEP